MASDLDAAVQDFARRFRAALDPPAQAGVTIGRAELAARFDEPLPEHGVPLETILGDLEARSAGGLAGGTGGRYFGYVTGGSLPAAAIVEAWTAAVDQNPGMWPLGAGRGRARAGDDPLARRSARSSRPPRGTSARARRWRTP